MKKGRFGIAAGIGQRGGAGAGSGRAAEELTWTGSLWALIRAGRNTPRFGGKVVLIDIGLSRVYDNVGKMGCLEIEGDRVSAIHRGQRLELPKDEKGPDMLRYLRTAAALDPAPSPLLKRIAELEK
jgi:hypothetical protein